MAEDYFKTIIDILSQYWWAIAIAVIVLIVLMLWKRQPKDTLKPVNRSEIERQLFIKRMEFNNTPYKTIDVWGKRKYRILKFQGSVKDDIKIFEFVLKPLLYGVLPYGKENGYVFRAEHFTFDTAEPETMYLKNGVTAWYRLGIFYDNSFSNDNITYFKRDFNAQTDWENLSSQYYASSQEASVVDPDRAHATLGAHLEIERIKEERKKQQLGS